MPPEIIPHDPLVRHHAWSTDPARDAAVRAAEDNRTGPLPTLKEAIAAVTETMSENGIGDETEQGMRQMLILSENRRVNAGAERDAAIRERDTALARVAELEAEQNAVAFVRLQTQFDAEWNDATASNADNLPETPDGSPQAASGGGEPTNQPPADGGRPPGGPSESAADDVRSRSASCADESAGGVAPTASGGGEGEPDYYVYKNEVGMIVSTSKKFEDGWAGCTIEPVYKAPPQPRGWLTEEEREAVQWAADTAYDKQHPAEDTLRSVLARSSPPEVVLPHDMGRHCGSEQYCLGWEAGLQDARLSIAAAGVAVKEVDK
jgi:hypothetical protein